MVFLNFFFYKSGKKRELTQESVFISVNQCLIPAFYYFSGPETRSSEAGSAGSSPAILEEGSAIIDISVE